MLAKLKPLMANCDVMNSNELRVTTVTTAASDTNEDEAASCSFTT
jgi:hypothetical protein